MKHKVLIPQPIADAGTHSLLDWGYEIVEPAGFEQADLQAAVSGCSAILPRTASVSRELLEAGENLRIVARHGAGVAEFTVMLLLMLAKRLPFFTGGLSRGDWSVRTAAHGTEVAGKTLLIVGLGRIGREVARRAALGLGMRVLAYSPSCRPDSAPEGVALVPDLREALALADFVSLHVPGGHATRGLLGARELACMKPTACLINCARGEVVDEHALAAALRDGSLAGAAVDVYDCEPPAADHPLLGLPQVIATPHIASNTRESMDRMARHAALEIHRVLSGERPHWPVNRPASPRG